MNKFLRFFIIILVGLLIYQRSKFSHTKLLHYSPTKTLQPYSPALKNYYHSGEFKHDAQLTFYEKYSRKKINNYLFTVDNLHKIEIALIDLGYIKVLNANYFAQGETFSFEEQVGVKLEERFDDFSSKINRNSENFRLNFESKQISIGQGKAVETIFDILVKRKGGEYSLKLVHVQPQKPCVTYVREGVVSYKCYGGSAVGEVNLLIDQNGNKVEKKISVTRENTIASFDGFRASGWEWQWVWGMGSGVDALGQRFSINLGTIREVGEDFVYIGDKTVKLNDFQYALNENSTVGESISFKSTSPVLDLSFKITAKERKYQDMVVLKSDMIKFEGYWSGTYTDPDTQNVITINHYPGLVEAADSIF